MVDALFNAVAAGDSSAVAELYERYVSRIHELFQNWATIPLEVRSDPVKTKWWAEGGIGVASVAAATGDDSLMAQLLGSPEDNLILTWQSSFVSAQSEAERGHHAEAIAILEPVLQDVEGLTGTAVDDLLPKSYGLLGASCHLVGDREKA